MAFKTFQNGFPLPASDLNNFLMKQSVIVFADVAARTAALPEPVEGMVTYLEDDNQLYKWTGADWVNVSPESVVTSQGDLIIGDNTGQETRLAIGTSGQILESNGTTLSYVTPDASPDDIITTQGDLIIGDASANAARIGIGAADTVLKSNGTTASWEALTSGGMTLISSTTLSGASVTISSIPATFKDLKVVVRDFQPVTNQRNLRLRLNGVTGSNYQHITSNTSDRAFAETFFTSDLDANSTGDGLAVFDIPDYANTVSWKQLDVFEIVKNATTPANAGIAKRFGAFNQTGAINSVTIFSSVDLNGGTVLVYGVA